MPVKVKDYKDFIKAHNKKNCPSVTGKKKAELKVLAESLGFKENDIKTVERKKAPTKKAPTKKAPTKKAPTKKAPMRAERKKIESKITGVDEKELKELLKDVEKILSVPLRNPNPKKDLKKITDNNLIKDLTIIIDNYIFDNDKKINKILDPIFITPMNRVGDVRKDAVKKFEKINSELGKDYKELFNKFKKYNAEMIIRNINTQPYIKRLNEYRKKNMEYIKRILKI
tara:strand:+ start:1229 stop:1912 length:684 start_codon:yes stop_codon:yes gene_type:complete